MIHAEVAPLFIFSNVQEEIFNNNNGIGGSEQFESSGLIGFSKSSSGRTIKRSGQMDLTALEDNSLKASTEKASNIQ